MIDYLLLYSPMYWHWYIFAAILILIELMIPGVYLLWFGLAAIAVGIATFFFALTPLWQIVVFAVLGPGIAYLGRSVYKLGHTMSTQDIDNHLNKRPEKLIGVTFYLKNPVAYGVSEVELQGTIWRVTGADMPAGTLVEVARVNGNTLVVREKQQ